MLGFPAPWRDLFRKSGRPLEAELARLGYELAPAGPAVVVFADGTELTWPADRAGQLDTLTTAYGRTVADELARPGGPARPGLADAAAAGLGSRAPRPGPVDLRSTPPAARAAHPGPPGPLVAASPPGSPGAQRRLPAGLHPRADPGLGRGRVVAAAHLRPLAAAAPGPGRRGRRGPFLGPGRGTGGSARAAPGQRAHRVPGHGDRRSRRPRGVGRHRHRRPSGRGGGQHDRPVADLRHAAATQRRATDPAAGETPSSRPRHRPSSTRRGTSRPARRCGSWPR